jgi:hypothetical protein
MQNSMLLNGIPAEYYAAKMHYIACNRTTSETLFIRIPTKTDQVR